MPPGLIMCLPTWSAEEDESNNDNKNKIGENLYTLLILSRFVWIQRYFCYLVMIRNKPIIFKDSLLFC